MPYEAAVGDIVRCVVPVSFVNGIHYPGTLHEVEEDTVEYFSIMTAMEWNKHLPHNYVVYALNGYIVEEEEDTIINPQENA